MIPGGCWYTWYSAFTYDLNDLTNITFFVLYFGSFGGFITAQRVWGWITRVGVLLGVLWVE
jgi:hypothetical protein